MDRFIELNIIILKAEWRLLIEFWYVWVIIFILKIVYNYYTE